MKHILLAFFITLAPFQAKAALEIDQAFTAKLYIEAFPAAHLSYVEEYINKKLTPYNCIGGNLSYDVLSRMESSWFGDDKPGKIKFVFQAYCKDANITGFQFGFDPAGYDEDYSQIALKITTNKGIVENEFCMYATRADYLKCPREYGHLKTLSVPNTK